MKNLTWQNPEQLFVAQELINKVKSKCCGIKVEGKRYAEISEILNIPEGTVKSQIHRIREQLKQSLAELLETDTKE